VLHRSASTEGVWRLADAIPPARGQAVDQRTRQHAPTKQVSAYLQTVDIDAAVHLVSSILKTIPSDLLRNGQDILCQHQAYVQCCDLHHQIAASLGEII